MPTDQHNPAGQLAVTIANLERATNQFRAAYALRYEAIHGDGALPGLSPEQLAQRKAILELADKIIQASATRLMDEVCRQWSVYRKMTT